MYLDTVKHLLWDEKLAASISLPLKTSKNQSFLKFSGDMEMKAVNYFRKNVPS